AESPARWTGNPCSPPDARRVRETLHHSCMANQELFRFFTASGALCRSFGAEFFNELFTRDLAWFPARHWSLVAAGPGAARSLTLILPALCCCSTAINRPCVADPYYVNLVGPKPLAEGPE